MCTASLTIDGQGNKIRYHPHHLNDHPPISTDYKKAIESKIPDLKIQLVIKLIMIQ